MNTSQVHPHAARLYEHFVDLQIIPLTSEDMGLLTLVLVCSLAFLEVTGGIAEDVTVYVDPFIGTEGPTGNGANSGDTFPGVSVPFGMVKIGPDTNEPDQASNPFAGYTPDGNGRLCLEICCLVSLMRYKLTC